MAWAFIGRLWNADCRPRILAAAVYAVAFLSIGSTLFVHSGFPLDDSWIHQVIARNFAQYHVMGFVPGKMTSGSSSLLWTCLLTAYYLLLPGVSSVVLNLLTSVLLLGGIGFQFKALAEEDGLPSGACWLIALAPATDGNFLWFGMIGMEHLLFIFLSICVVRIWFRSPLRRSKYEDLQLALLLFFLVLTRIEGIFIGIVLLLSTRRAGRTFQSLLVSLAGISMGAFLITYVNWRISGRLLSQTMRGRQFLYDLSAGHGLKIRLYFLGQIFARLLKTWSFYASTNLLHNRGLVFGIPLSLIVAFLLFAALLGLWKAKAQRLLLLCLWAAVIGALYCFMLPSTGHGGRYLALPLFLFMPLLLFGLYRVLSKFASLPHQAVVLLIVCIALLSAARSLTVWRQATSAQIDQINSEHGGVASWLKTNVPAEYLERREVAVFDIGRIGYEFHGNLTDLGGLLDQGFLPYVLQHRTVDYLRLHNIRYIVLPSAEYDNSVDWMQRLHLDNDRDASFLLIHSVCIDEGTDSLAENSASTAYGCQRIYRISYSDPLPAQETP